MSVMSLLLGQPPPAAHWQVPITPSGLSTIIASQREEFSLQVGQQSANIGGRSSLARPFVAPALGWGRQKRNLHLEDQHDEIRSLLSGGGRQLDQDEEQFVKMNGKSNKQTSGHAANSVKPNQYRDSSEEFNLDYNEQGYINQQHPQNYHQQHHQQQQQQQHKNKRPVYVSISQQTVNGLLSLLLLFIVAICGCLGTIFIMSALTVIESLQTRGNCYLVSLALAHLLVTLLVVPSSALQIMAGDSINGRQLCHYQWLTLELSLIVSQLSFFLIAADSYLGYKSSERVTASTAALANERPANKTPSSLAGWRRADRDNGEQLANSCGLSMIKQAPDKLANELKLPPTDTDSAISGKALGQPATGASLAQQRIINEQLACLLQRDSSIRSAGNERSHKLRLAKELDLELMMGAGGSSERQLEAPGCLGYRTCCGRLKVLIWILLVWTTAILYTYHQHELSYGPRFCTGAAAASSRRPINTSIHLGADKSTTIIAGALKTPTMGGRRAARSSPREAGRLSQLAGRRAPTNGQSLPDEQGRRARDTVNNGAGSAQPATTTMRPTKSRLAGPSPMSPVHSAPSSSAGRPPPGEPARGRSSAARVSRDSVAGVTLSRPAEGSRTKVSSSSDDFQPSKSNGIDTLALINGQLDFRDERAVSGDSALLVPSEGRDGMQTYPKQDDEDDNSRVAASNSRTRHDSCHRNRGRKKRQLSFDANDNSAPADQFGRPPGRLMTDELAQNNGRRHETDCRRPTKSGRPSEPSARSSSKSAPNQGPAGRRPRSPTEPAAWKWKDSNEGGELNLMNNDHLILAPSEQQTSDPQHLLHGRPPGAPAEHSASLVQRPKSRQPAEEQRPLRQHGAQLEPSDNPSTLFWCMLIGCVLAPSLASSLLFARAYVRMKQFRQRANKPMPLAAINARLASLLIGAGPVSPPPAGRQTIRAAAAAAAAADSERPSDLLAADDESKSDEDEDSRPADNDNTQDWQDRCQQSTELTNQPSERSVSQPSAPCAFQQPAGQVFDDGQLLGRTRLLAGRLQADRRANLRLDEFQVHKQVDQVLSEPIGFPHVHQVSGNCWLGQSRLSPIAASQVEPDELRGSLVRDHSFSAPPSASFQSAGPAGGLEYALAARPNELGLEPALFGGRLAPAGAEPLGQEPEYEFAGPKSRPFEFSRHQFHAQSFHLGCSRNQSQPAQAKRQLDYERAQVVEQQQQQQQQQVAEEDQFDPEHHQEQRLRLNLSRQLASPLASELEGGPMQLLERHRSLPRSSRLYLSESGQPHLQRAMAAPDSVGQQLPQRRLPAEPTHQAQSRRLQMSDVSQESRPAATTTGADNGDQSASSIMSAALANVIKSQMDKSQSPPASNQQLDYLAAANSANDAPEPNKNQQSRPEGSPAVKPLPSKVILCNYSYMTDDQLLRSNIIVFILNLTLWLPFVCLSIGSQYRDNLSQELKDGVWWLATLNCCSCSYVYALTNKDFRDAFNKLFYYCCCKSHVTFPRKTPIFRRQLELDSSGNLRIHIIPGLNVYSNKLTRSPADQPAGQPLGLAGQLGQAHQLAGHHHRHFATSLAGPSEPAGLASSARPRPAGQAHQSAASQQASQKHLTMSVGGGFGGPLFGAGRHLAHASAGRPWLAQRHSPASEL